MENYILSIDIIHICIYTYVSGNKSPKNENSLSPGKETALIEK